MLTIIILRNISNCNSQKCWRQMLATIISRSAGDACYLLQFSEMLTTNVKSQKTQKCWGQMVSIIFFRNVDDRYYNSNYKFQKCWRQMLAIIIPEMLVINVSNYIFQNCWRQMLIIRMFRNTGDKKTIIIADVHHKNYNYNFWRARQQSTL